MNIPCLLDTTWGTSARRRLVLEERMTLLQFGHLEADGSYLGSKRSALKGHNKPVCARFCPSHLHARIVNYLPRTAKASQQSLEALITSVQWHSYRCRTWLLAIVCSSPCAVSLADIQLVAVRCRRKAVSTL